MYGRMYSVGFEGQSVTNAGGDNDLLEIGPADDKIIIIHSLSIDVTSELGDAAEELLRLKIIRGHTSSSNGSAATPRPFNPSDTACGAACETIGTTIASAGTAVDLWQGAFNVRVGLREAFPERWRPIVTQAQGLLVVRLMAAVTDDVTMTLNAVIEEIG